MAFPIRSVIFINFMIGYASNPAIWPVQKL
jgi:hypothetical protein